MNTLFQKIKLLIADRALRGKLLFTLGALIVFRFLSAIPVPGVISEALERLFAANQFLNFVDVFSGGGLSSVSIVMLGVGPYITASIVMQLLTMIFPKLKEMYSEEGDAGRKKFTQYSRLLTVPLALLSAFGFTILLQKQGVFEVISTFNTLVTIVTIAGGSMLLMWIGELITEFGIGNGVSLIIFAGIVTDLPDATVKLVQKAQAGEITLFSLLIIACIVVSVVGLIIFFERGQRRIPVQYAKRQVGRNVFGGQSTHLPLKVNTAGVIPPIFASSILMFPSQVASYICLLYTSPSPRD